MNIILNNSSMVPIYEQLMDQIKNKIIEGTLKSGEVLPSVRSLSSELRISALTVKKAYDQLEKSGLIITVHGKGSYVAEIDKNLAFEACRKAIEDEFAKVILKAKNFNLSNEEIQEIVSIILEES